MNMKLKLIKSTAKIPTRSTRGSAGYDLYCPYDVIIKPHQTVRIASGLAIALSSQTFAAIYPRSSIGVKRHLMLANGVGIIDSDYRGEIIIPYYNYGDEIVHIGKGERFCQMIIQPYGLSACKDKDGHFVEGFDVVDDLDETDRNDGGFGSTGL